MRYLGTCDGNMQEGSLRADVNVSVRKVGEKKFGTRCEIKNVNSIRFMQMAIEHEARRQVESGHIKEQNSKIDKILDVLNKIQKKRVIEFGDIIKGMIVIATIVGITFGVMSYFNNTYGSQIDKAPIYQGKTDKECIDRAGVDMSWIEVFHTGSYTHYINREVNHAVVCHKDEMMLFVIKGTEDVSIIIGQMYSDGNQCWQLFKVDINDDSDEFTKRYREMLDELRSLAYKPEQKCN